MLISARYDIAVHRLYYRIKTTDARGAVTAARAPLPSQDAAVWLGDVSVELSHRPLNGRSPSAHGVAE